jgi:cell wall-associated NlpC family hydrolase
MAVQQAIAIGVADVRREPGETAELVTQALLGTPATILDEYHGWTHIKLPDYEGWVTTAHLATPASPLGPWGAVITRLAAPLFAAASGADTLDTVFLSTVFPLRECDPSCGRLAVILPDNRIGWIAATDAVIRPLHEPFPRTNPGKAVAVAYRFLGTPYLWGGVTVRGIDCSGLVQLCMRMAGYILPRDSYQQCQALPTEVKGPAEPGDLLFFGREGRITHVAMALAPNGQVIHAEGALHHQVCIDGLNPLSANYHKRLADLYLTTRRIL